MNPDPVPTTSIAGRVADYLFEALRSGVTFAPTLRDRGEKEFLEYTGGPGGAIAFQPAEVTFERGLFLVRFELPDFAVAERIRPGRLPVSITIHAPRGRSELLTHYGQLAAQILTNVSTTLIGDPEIQVWYDRQAGRVGAETDDYVIERIDHEYEFQPL